MGTLTVGRAVDLPHAALADEGGDFIGAEAGAWAEGHVGSGNGGAILPPVGLSGTHNGRAGFARSGAASDWLSQAHVRMLSDDPGGSEGPRRWAGTNGCWTGNSQPATVAWIPVETTSTS